MDPATHRGADVRCTADSVAVADLTRGPSWANNRREAEYRFASIAIVRPGLTKSPARRDAPAQSLHAHQGLIVVHPETRKPWPRRLP